MLPLPPESRWKIIRSGALIIRSWDDGSVVFNTLSGETLQVSLLAAELLHILDSDDSGKSVTDICELLADVFADAGDDERCSWIIDALSRLQVQGLVAPEVI